MELKKAEYDMIGKIVEMSIRAFRTDTAVGGVEGDCPPDYDSPAWHRQMAEEGHLYQAEVDGEIVGGAILFENEKNRSLYVGRIFIDSCHHRKGYGLLLMQCIENNFPDIREFNLDTPEWNVRTNAFYQKLGYSKVKVEDGFTFYMKER